MKSTKNALILFLTVFIDMMGFSVIFPIFPETLKFFWQKGGDSTLFFFQNLVEWIHGPGDKYYIIVFGGLTGSIYAILQFIFAPIWGRLSDRIGRKPVLIFTSTGNFLGYIVWLFSGNFTLFVISRVITGCMGGNISVASAAMADVTTEENRTKGMGMIGAGIGLGFILGPPLGGILSGVDTTILYPVFLKNHHTVFSAAALLSVIIALSNLLLILFSFTESNTHIGTVPKDKKLHPILGILSTHVKELPLLSLIYFLFIMGFSGFEFSLNFFLNDTLNFTPKEIGFSFVYMGSIVILIQGGVIRRISGKIKEKKIAIFGIAFLIIGFGLLSISKTSPITMISLFFLSTGSALVNPSLSSLASLFSPKNEQGKNMGTLRGFGSLARAFSPMVFALIYFQLGPNFSFILSGIFSFVVLLLLLKIPNRKD